MKAAKCEDIAAVERAEKADLLDVRDAKEALAARVRALEGDVEAARSRAGSPRRISPTPRRR